MYISKQPYDPARKGDSVLTIEPILLAIYTAFAVITYSICWDSDDPTAIVIPTILAIIAGIFFGTLQYLGYSKMTYWILAGAFVFLVVLLRLFFDYMDDPEDPEEDGIDHPAVNQMLRFFNPASVLAVAIFIPWYFG